MPWVRHSTWRDMRAREERVEELLERWDSHVSAARSDPGKFSSAFEVLAHAQMSFTTRWTGFAMMTTSRGCRGPNWS